MIRTLCIVLLGSIGDVARGLALVGPIKNRYPGIHITWVVEPKSRQVVELHSGIDRVVVFNRSPLLRASIDLIKTLRAMQFDVVLDLQRHFKSGVISRITGATRRVGFDRNSAKEFNWLFSNEKIPSSVADVAKIRRYLTFLPMIDVPIPDRLEFGIKEASLGIDVSTLNLPSKKFVTFVLGSSWDSKDWLVDGYLALGRLILESPDRRIVLLGDRSQIQNAERILAQLGSNVVNCVGVTDLKGAIGVIARASVLVGPDSGPGHIAAAIGVPQVTLFGPTDPVVTAPWGSEDLVVKGNLGCMPCYRRRCPGLNKLCMRMITPNEVFRFVLPLLD